MAFDDYVKALKMKEKSKKYVSSMKYDINGRGQTVLQRNVSGSVGGKKKDPIQDAKHPVYGGELKPQGLRPKKKSLW